MRRAALSGWFQLPVQGLTSCHLAGKSGSNVGVDAALQHRAKIGSLHVFLYFNWGLYVLIR